MIKDGDKILVCVSGSSSSLCLMHGIRQFSRARGLHIELGAVTIAENLGLDPRCLMLHMKSFEKDGVEYIFEQGNAAPELIESKLSMIAQKRGYNTLALGNNLDKLADDFLASLFLRGHLHVTPACKRLE
jgi:tRNA(Ile)-lysidine synthase TilS/MesJ